MYTFLCLQFYINLEEIFSFLFLFEKIKWLAQKLLVENRVFQLPSRSVMLMAEIRFSVKKYPHRSRRPHSFSPLNGNGSRSIAILRSRYHRMLNDIRRSRYNKRYTMLNQHTEECKAIICIWYHIRASSIIKYLYSSSIILRECANESNLLNDNRNKNIYI